MRMLADENFPVPVLQELRRRGHDVFSVTEEMPGAADEQVLARAAGESRLLLTLDRDFGDLIYRRRLVAPVGVILFRLSGRTPEDDNRRTLLVLERPDEWSGRFTTVTDTLIRSRAFPAP